MKTISNANSELIAISYDTATFNDLNTFIAEEGRSLIRVTPDEFIKNYNEKASYINLILNDIEERKEVSHLIDQRKIERFSYVHPSTTIYGLVGGGCMVYPQVVMYLQSKIADDVLVHSHSLIAHKVTIGAGSILSGGVVIGGSTNIGKYCRLCLHTTIHDKVTICDNTVIGAATTIRKNITKAGTYSNISKLHVL